MAKKKGILYRWFGVGKMPQVVRDEIAGENALFQSEGVRVALHRSGHVPGAVVKGGVNVGWGSFAVTDKRVIGSRGKVKWVDVPYDVGTGGPITLTVDEAGVHLLFDLDHVDASTSGKMTIDYREEIPADVVARFPVRELSFTLDPQKVVRLFGSLKKIPDRPAGS